MSAPSATRNVRKLDTTRVRSSPASRISPMTIRLIWKSATRPRRPSRLKTNAKAP